MTIRLSSNQDMFEVGEIVFPAYRDEQKKMEAQWQKEWDLAREQEKKWAIEWDKYKKEKAASDKTLELWNKEEAQIVKSNQQLIEKEKKRRG